MSCQKTQTKTKCCRRCKISYETCLSLRNSYIHKAEIQHVNLFDSINHIESRVFKRQKDISLT